MIIDAEKLVNNITENFPSVKSELKIEHGFVEIKITGNQGSMLFLYPNDAAWFVNLYSSQELYQEYVFNIIKQNLLN